MSHAPVVYFMACFKFYTSGKGGLQRSQALFDLRGERAKMHIVKKSLFTAVLAAVASVLMVLIVVPLAGGEVSTLALAMSTLCPLLIAGPASAWSAWQTEKLRQANAQLARAHADLALAHARLAERRAAT
jgi:hypothetical protein